MCILELVCERDDIKKSFLLALWDEFCVLVITNDGMSALFSRVARELVK